MFLQVTRVVENADVTEVFFSGDTDGRAVWNRSARTLRVQTRGVDSLRTFVPIFTFNEIDDIMCRVDSVIGACECVE